MPSTLAITAAVVDLSKQRIDADAEVRRQSSYRLLRHGTSAILDRGHQGRREVGGFGYILDGLAIGDAEAVNVFGERHRRGLTKGGFPAKRAVCSVAETGSHPILIRQCSLSCVDHSHRAALYAWA